MKKLAFSVVVVLCAWLVGVGCLPATGPAPEILGTSHPMVWLYEVNPFVTHPGLDTACVPEACEISVRVQIFKQPGKVLPDAAQHGQAFPGQALPSKAWLGFSTPWEPISDGVTEHIYLAGMRADTVYQFRHTIRNASTLQVIGIGKRLLKLTGPAGWTKPQVTVTAPSGWTTDEPVLLVSPLNGTDRWFAVDAEGELIWYNQNGPLDGILTSPTGTGNFLGGSGGTVREVDSRGNTVTQVSVAGLGIPLPLLGPHHDGVRLPEGKTAFLSSYLKDVPPNRRLLGDVVVVLGAEQQVEWVWDSFEHLDVSRPAILSEICSVFTGCGGPATGAEDWMHANALEYDPADGNLIISVRNQDWVIKVDYADGTGSGAVVWRLGREGDFVANTEDPNPWPTHMHDTTLGAAGLHVYDNGNTRCQLDGDCESRGQVWVLDEVNMIATPVMNERLGFYAFAIGGSRPTTDGAHFTTGLAPGGSSCDEYASDGSGLISSFFFPRMNIYRSFRLPDLYSTPE
jgi:arylsulfate sulfotransferase